MTLLAWPFERNHIRRDIRNNAFGMVRNGGSRVHQGWDLYAVPGTPLYAEGKIEYARPLWRPR
jgi:murein DD-endopeptidase MepM/ murein hydrolase activator NlpD